MGRLFQRFAHKKSVHCSRNPTTNPLGTSNAILRSTSANILSIVDVVVANDVILTATNNHSNER
jgi:hypothetical protein